MYELHNYVVLRFSAKIVSTFSENQGFSLLVVVIKWKTNNYIDVVIAITRLQRVNVSHIFCFSGIDATSEYIITIMKTMHERALEDEKHTYTGLINNDKRGKDHSKYFTTIFFKFWSIYPRSFLKNKWNAI